jgi:Amidohydrolase
MYKLAMQRAGIDYMVVYPSTGLLTTAVPDLPANTAAAYRRAYNNWLHDFCAAAGGGLVGAAAVDLRDAKEAAREARHCVKEFDFKAVYINPVPAGEHRLYDDFYEPLWNTLEDLDVPLAVHAGTGNAADQMLYYWLPRLRTAQTTVAFTVGNMLACTALIMGVSWSSIRGYEWCISNPGQGGCRFGSTDSPPVSRAGSEAWTFLDSRCSRLTISNASVSLRRIRMTQASSKSSTISWTTTL